MWSTASEPDLWVFFGQKRVVHVLGMFWKITGTIFEVKWTSLYPYLGSPKKRRLNQKTPKICLLRKFHTNYSTLLGLDRNQRSVWGNCLLHLEWFHSPLRSQGRVKELVIKISNPVFSWWYLPPEYESCLQITPTGNASFCSFQILRTLLTKFEIDFQKSPTSDGAGLRRSLGLFAA